MSFHSLRFRVFGFLIALLVLLLVLLNTVPTVASRNLVFEEKKNSMILQASVVSSSLSGLGELSSAGVQEVLAQLELSGYDRVSVADNQHRPVFDLVREPLSAPEPLDAVYEGKNVFRSVFRQREFLSAAAVPVYSGSQLIGAVMLYERDAEQGALILEAQEELARISAAVSVFALLLAGGFFHVFLSRIQELVSSMRVVAAGNYAYRLETHGQDEITELGDEFNRLTACLEENEEQRRRFVSDASHELKTPLASIRLLSDSIVQNEMDADTMREFVTDIGHEAERLQRTTEKLLDLSRLDDGVQIVPEPVDVKQIVKDALSVLQPLADERGIAVTHSLEDGCVIMATGDDMFHIIFNLLENAVKYNVPEGNVDISVQGDAETVRITVSDTGIGIPEEDRLNIFSRFYRVDKARSRASGGSGLGLSIVHDAVIRHGGTIAVGQNKPQGSRFIVSLPRATSEETGI